MYASDWILLATWRVQLMSPAPFRTCTWISHGFGSDAACATIGSTGGADFGEITGTTTNARIAISAADTDATTISRRRRVHAERPRRYGQAREPACLSAVDLERGAEQERRLERVLDGGEAVDAALLEPLDLLGRQARPLRGLLERQPPLQPCRRERRAAGRRWVEEGPVEEGPVEELPVEQRRVVDELEWADGLHRALHRFAGRGS